MRVEVLVADLADRDATGAGVRPPADDERPVDLLVNNAGFGLHRSFLDNDLAQEEAALDVMVRAVLLTCHAAGRAMRARGHGAILNVSSVASFIANGTYSAEKSFVTVFSEGLASELAGTGVTVTALCPGLHPHRVPRSGRGRRCPRSPAFAVARRRRRRPQALADVAAGKVVSVPGALWKVLTIAVRLLPRPLVRGAPMRAARPVPPALSPAARRAHDLARYTRRMPVLAGEGSSAQRPHAYDRRMGPSTRARGAPGVPPPPAHRLRRLAGDGPPPTRCGPLGAVRERVRLLGGASSTILLAGTVTAGPDDVHAVARLVVMAERRHPRLLLDGLIVRPA